MLKISIDKINLRSPCEVSYADDYGSFKFTTNQEHWLYPMSVIYDTGDKLHEIVCSLYGSGTIPSKTSINLSTVRMDDPLSGPVISEFKEIVAELDDHEKLS